jgi:hypothetical protein
VEDVLDLAEIEGLADVMVAKFEARLLPKVLDVAHVAGEQVVDA